MSRKLALIIGSSEYEDASLARLVTPGADANALAEVLGDPQIGGFDEVAALVNEPSPTIRRAIAGFFADRGRDDLLVLYFSGHGVRDDRGQLYLAVKDTEHQLLRGTAIPAAFITEEMDNSRSRRQVLILDCCHSGAFSQGMKGSPGASVGTAAAFEGAGFGRVVLTATDSTQYAWEGDQVIGQAEHSVFTHYLIEGLRTGMADIDGDGQITLDELYDFAYERVVNETPRQTPSKWSYRQQGDMVIAQNPHPFVKPVELPPDLQQTMDDPRPWVREGAVRELDRLMSGSHAGMVMAAQEALRRLADDDSRRVAAAAANSLSTFAEKHPAAANSLSAFAEKHPAAADSLPSIAQTQPKAVEDNELLGLTSAWSGKAVEDEGRLVDDREGEFSASRVEPAVMDRRFIRKQILLITAGWALAGLIGGFLGWYSSDSAILLALIGGSISGVATGLVLRNHIPTLRWQPILTIATGWVIAWGIEGAIAQADTIAHVVANTFYADIGWETAFIVGSGLEGIIGGILSGAAGGLTTGLVIWEAGHFVLRKPFVMTILGWVAGSAAGSGIFYLLGEASEWNYPMLVVLTAAICMAMTGAIGSVIMFSQMRKVNSSQAAAAPGMESPG